jgi:hypothetical protein
VSHGARHSKYTAVVRLHTKHINKPSHINISASASTTSSHNPSASLEQIRVINTSVTRAEYRPAAEY